MNNPPDVLKPNLNHYKYLLGNGALLAPCRRWIGKCKCARPQNEFTQLATRMRETPILSLRAAWRFSGVANPCSTRGAQLAFGKTPLRRPQTLRGRAKTQPPGAGCPRDVRDELRSKFGCHRPNIERMVRPIRFGGSIERMVYDEFWGCGRADCGLSYSPATRCRFRGRGPHSNRYRTVKGHRKAAAAKWGIFSRRRRRRATHPAQLREIARARVIV